MTIDYTTAFLIGTDVLLVASFFGLRWRFNNLQNFCNDNMVRIDDLKDKVFDLKADLSELRLKLNNRGILPYHDSCEVK